LYENQEFREEYELYSDKAVERWFTDNLFADYGLDFLELKLIYKYYPFEKDWKEKSVSELFAIIQEDVEEPIKNTRKTRSWMKDYLELKKELDRANEKIVKLQTEIEIKDRQIVALKFEMDSSNGELNDVDAN